MASNFYKDLLEHDFYDEKIASENSNTQGMLESFSTDQIEALAEELGLLFDKTADEDEETLEDKTAGECVDKLKDSVAVAKSKASDAVNTGKEKVSKAVKGGKKKYNKTVAKLQAMINEKRGKVASEEEIDEIVKTAYEVAGEKLAEAGLNTVDHVFTKIANEDMAVFIADKAEKLAYLTDQSPIKVADDIVDSIEDLITEDDGDDDGEYDENEEYEE